MIVFPKAKINLGLRITAKRSDGYHDIETIFYPVGLCDAVEFVVDPSLSQRDSLTVTGIDTGGDIENNLVIKATRLLRERFAIPFFKIHLHKAIPVGAGLGGGSSDAVFLLGAINRCFRLSIPNVNMKSLALELGSDCPFFVDSAPAIGTGRGEILEPLNEFLKGYYLVLLNPGVRINTREAYQNCRPEPPQENLIHFIEKPIGELRKYILNDFEQYAITKHQVINIIKNELYSFGALFSLMSGSGSSVYGIFKVKPDLPQKLKEFLIWEGFI